MKVAGVELTGRDFGRWISVLIAPLAAGFAQMIRDGWTDPLWELLVYLGIGLFFLFCVLTVVVIRRRDDKAGHAASPPSTK